MLSVTLMTPLVAVLHASVTVMSELLAPDVLIVGSEWPQRALLRAQLIEEGYEAVGVDTWPIPRPYRQPGMKPAVLILDLRGLPNPREALNEVRVVMAPERVLVITALGTLTSGDIRRLGFPVIERPATIGNIVAAVAALRVWKQDARTPTFATGD